MKTFIGVFLILILVTFAMTFPLMLRLNSAIPGFESSDEPFGGLWSLWWMRFSHFNHQDYNSCKMIAYPSGRDFSKGVVDYPLWNFLNRGASIVFNEAIAYNLNVIFGFLLSGIFMFYLARFLIRSVPAALFSALIFAFSPYHFVRSWQHVGLANTQWMVLYIWALLLLMNKINLRNLLFALAAIFLVFSFDYYYAYFMVIATAAVFLFNTVFRLIHQPKSDEGSRIKGFKADTLAIGIIMVFCALLILPVALKVFNTPVHTDNSAWVMSRRAFEDLFEQSAKPLSYLLPFPQQPVLGKITQPFLGSELYGRSLTEHVLFLGWVPLILAFFAVKKRWWRQKTSQRDNFYIGQFIFLGLVFWVFSQAPWWQFGDFKVYLPSFFMYKFLPMFRAYCRFGILVMLAVAVLAGFGFDLLLRNYKSKLRATLMGVFLSLLVIFEFWSYPPFKIIDLNNIPEAYSWLKAQADDVVVAEYPLDLDSPNELYKFYQTKHEKKIINGSIPGTPENIRLREIADLSAQATLDSLKRIGVKYLVVHSQDYLNSGLVKDLRELEGIKINRGLGLKKNYSDGILIFELKP